MVGLEGDFVRGMFRVCLGIVCVGLDVGLGRWDLMWDLDGGT